MTTRNHLLDEVTELSFEDVNYNPEDNSWSIAQVCHHVALTEETFAKAIAYGLKKSNVRAEQKKIDFMLDRSNKLKAPEIVQPPMDSLKTEQIIDLLSQSRNLLMSVLNTVEDNSILTEKSVQHPFLGELPLNQWIELIYLHEQRHIEQIKEIKSYAKI
ncbi:DinB family protein [Paenisporosarcina sp. NPDC076898]|uniref:DinB family protein n=1 Tax=unclassified Paenisporosarcina TaxID=2642018 RepID=UPI003D083101